MNGIAQQIQQARLKAKMSEKDLAKKCGVAASYITQVETGKKVANEKMLEKILDILGVKMDLSFGAAIEKEEKAQSAVPKVKVVAAPPVQAQPLEPNAQWAEALSGIVKKYPIHDLATNKTAGYKAFPIINKKVEGYAAEKLMFIKMAENDLQGLRLMKGDIVMVNIVKELQGRGAYLIEIDNKKMVRVVQKEGNKYAVSKGQKNEPPTLLGPEQVKVVGKCIRVEFNL